MSERRFLHCGHGFPHELISYAAWLYHGYTLGSRDVEDLLAESGVMVSYGSIRLLREKLGPQSRGKLQGLDAQPVDIWQVDEDFIRICGQIHYVWRAVVQGGDVIGVLVQRRRDALVAKRFFDRAFRCQRSEPMVGVANKLRSYPPAAREALRRTPTTPPSTPTIEWGFPINGPGNEPTRCDISCSDTKPSILSLHGQVQKLLSDGCRLLRALGHLPCAARVLR